MIRFMLGETNQILGKSKVNANNVAQNGIFLQNILSKKGWQLKLKLYSYSDLAQSEPHHLNFLHLQIQLSLLV